MFCMNLDRFKLFHVELYSCNFQILRLCNWNNLLDFKLGKIYVWRKLKKKLTFSKKKELKRGSCMQLNIQYGTLTFTHIYILSVYGPRSTDWCEHSSRSVKLFHVIHIAQQLLHRNLSDGLLEEELLDVERRYGPKARHEKQESAEAGGLSRVLLAHVIAQDALSLVLQHLHRVVVAQTDGFCWDNDRLDADLGNPIFNFVNQKQRLSCC